ncbi:TPA: head completion/stabilization protein, partial [Escherichia coli]
MSLIARPRVNSADTDTTDTDDGDAMVSAGDFWPAISLHEIRLASRIPGRTTTTRLLHAATEAVAHVIAELELWKRERMAEGAASLADVPATQVNGESVHVHRYRRAVFALT